MNTRPLAKAGSVLAAVSALLVVGVPNASATLSFSPTSHNFGNQLVGTTGGKTFTLTATCDNVVVVSCISPPGGVHTTNLGTAGTGFALGTTNCGVLLNASASSPASCTVE